MFMFFFQSEDFSQEFTMLIKPPNDLDDVFHDRDHLFCKRDKIIGKPFCSAQMNL